MSNDDTTLDDFGCSRTVSPPRIQKRQPVKTTQVYPSVLAGYAGPVPERSSHGFVKVVDREEHRYWKLAEDRGGAYAISDDAFRKATEVYGASWILVVEEDTGDVYEWAARRWDNDVPNKYLQDTDDPQTYAPLDTARCWEGHETDVYIDDSVDVTSVGDPR